MTKFTETFASELPEAKDGVIRGAKLIGLTSRNGRTYRDSALQKAKSLYEGRKVFINHPRPGDNERQLADWAGVVENVKHRKNDGLYGDIVLRKNSPYFEGLVEISAHPTFRKSCGFSHVAEGESNYDDGSEIIESISKVHSVDLVCEPATTNGLFESVQPTTTRDELEIREALETLPASQKALRDRWVEMMDAGFMGDDFSLGGGGGDKEQPADQFTQLTAILRDTIAALADSLKALAKASKPPAPLTPPPGEPGAGKSEPGKPPFEKSGEEGEGSEDEEMTDEDKEKIAAFESMQRENAELKASKLLLESGRQATAVRMKALANCATDEEQQELLESWPKVEDTGRPTRSAPLIESDTDFPRDNPEKFAALLR